MSLDTVVGYLTEAPKIVHDLQPVVWQFLEAPPDGTVLLVWQPLDYLGTNFASDGYVWGDAEHAFNSEHNGYVCNAPQEMPIVPNCPADGRDVVASRRISLAQ
jgi:Fungal domain of unknown function (DUF1750)